MRHIISVRRLANLNRAWSHLFHSLGSSHEYHIHCQSEDFRANYTCDHMGPPTMLLSLEWLAYFKHVVQSLSSTWSFWCPLLVPHLTTYHSTTSVHCCYVEFRHVYINIPYTLIGLGN